MAERNGELGYIKGKVEGISNSLSAIIPKLEEVHTKVIGLKCEEHARMIEEQKTAMHGLSSMVMEIKEDVEPSVQDYEDRAEEMKRNKINLRHVCLEVFIIVSSAAIIGYAGYLLRGVV